jgi:AraC-like DNA-binding protein
MLDENDTDLLLSLPQALLDSTVVDTGYAVASVELRNRHQLRDLELPVELGRSLLLHSSLSIAEIAQTTGFAHQSHMARHMRKILGVTPGDLRRTS